jgi:glycosyltransferase involved in cell wall biosynthesis
MNIGFEAKRVFQNTTGLGNATRSIVKSLATYYPNHQYHLYAPRISTLFPNHLSKNIAAHAPNFMLGTIAKAWWRSSGVVKQLAEDNIDIFIGLAAELPIGLAKKNIPSIVFVHDVIFERYPQQYNGLDIITYRKKTKYACKVATAIVTNSQQTKQDLIDFYNIPAHKITVVYLSCNEKFYTQQSVSAIESIKQKYNLPAQYFLSVGSIIERKGLLKICEAYTKHTIEMPPLVVIGNGKNEYANRILTFVKQNNLQHKIIFLNQMPQAQDADFKNSIDLPAIYQGAIALIYPSVFEGFGLPVLEAMARGVAVITSNSSCLPEVGGDAALYVNPLDANDIANAMENLFTNKELREQCIAKGVAQAEKFSEKELADRMWQVIEIVVKKTGE